MADRVWFDKDDATLTELWTTKPVISTAEIGRRMNKSKNAVVGRSNRLDLPARPSPIRRSAGGPQSPLPPRVRDRPTLPALASVVSAQTKVLPPLPDEAPIVVPSKPVFMAPLRAAPLAPKPFGRVISCCWPTSDGRPWTFCDEPSRPASSYCQTHHDRGLVRVRDRREDFAHPTGDG